MVSAIIAQWWPCNSLEIIRIGNKPVLSDHSPISGFAINYEGHRFGLFRQKRVITMVVRELIYEDRSHPSSKMPCRLFIYEGLGFQKLFLGEKSWISVQWMRHPFCNTAPHLSGLSRIMSKEYMFRYTSIVLSMITLSCWTKSWLSAGVGYRRACGLLLDNV